MPSGAGTSRVKWLLLVREPPPLFHQRKPRYCWSLSTLPSAPTISWPWFTGPSKSGGRDPVVVEVDAHAVVEIHAHLHGVVGVDAVAHEALLLADGGERDRFALVVGVNQVRPVRARRS